MITARDATALREMLAVADLDGLPTETRQEVIAILREGALRMLPFVELIRFAEYGFRVEGTAERPIDFAIRTTRTALLDDGQPDGSRELLSTLSWSVQRFLDVLAARAV